MILDNVDEKAMPSLEGTKFFLRDGQLRYLQGYYPSGHTMSIPATWIKCDQCGKIVPGQRFNAKKYCSTKCAYADRKMEKSANWKGGRQISERGYIRIQLADGRRMQEHRYIMEQVLGRKLYQWEHVHHINGITGDNRPENLEIWLVKSKMHPVGQRLNDYLKNHHCPGCNCFK